MGSKAPYCRLCGTEHWVRDGHKLPDPVRLAQPRICRLCNTEHAADEKCPPKPVTIIKAGVAQMGVPRPPASPSVPPGTLAVAAGAGSSPASRSTQPQRNELSPELSEAQPKPDNYESQPYRGEAGFDKKAYMRDYMRTYRKGERRREKVTR